MCNHLVGFSKSKIVDSKTGETLTQWMSEVRASRLPGLYWEGWDFSFCPECGADVREIVHTKAALTGFVVDSSRER